MEHRTKHNGRFTVDGGPKVPVRWWLPVSKDGPETAGTRPATPAGQGRAGAILIEPIDLAEADYLDDVVGLLDLGTRQMRGRVYRTGAVFSFRPKQAD